MKLSCKRCRHTWTGEVALWDRGHLLMRRGRLNAFVYAWDREDLPTGIDFPPLLQPIGFSPYVPVCEKCGSDDITVVRGLLVSPDAYGQKQVRCLQLTANDLIHSAEGWRLKDEVVKALLDP
jgi:hypothetical protein